MKNFKLRIITFLLIVLGLISAGILSRSRFNVVPRLVSNLAPALVRVEFPQVNSSQLSPTQRKFIAVLRREYDSQPKGLKYSEGIHEPWCADFVSWTFKEAGQPLINPSSKSWRIPGTFTLREYYKSTGRFRAADSSYSPIIGDVMLYDNPSPFGQHTNVVIKNNHGIITTVGGNEPGGIRVFVHTTPDKAGFIGYGTLNM